MKRKITWIILAGIVILLAFIGLHSKETVHTATPGTVFSWGENDDGQLGAASSTLYENILSVSAGREHTLALTHDNHVVSWGNNEWGQLGRKIKGPFEAQPAIIPNLDHVIAISAKNNQSLALKEDGTVWAWGSNFTGALGTGDNANRDVPTQVKNLDNVVKISAGYKFSLALKEDGTVWAWGASCDDANKQTALKILNNKGGTSLEKSEGSYYNINSRSDGAYTHGEDCLNEDVVGIKSTTPIHLAGLDDASDISVGYGHALILKKDGSVWTFGCNMYGQIGNGTMENKADSNPIPKKVAHLPAIKSISAGFRHSLALSKDGRVFAWGIETRTDKNHNTFNSPLPQEVMFTHTPVSIIAGHDYSLAIDASGILYGWGEDHFNLFGPTKDSFIASPIGLDTSKKIVSATAGAGYIATIGEK